MGACPDTRANNYGDDSLNIVNKCTDPITSADTTTCNNVIDKGEERQCASYLLLNDTCRHAVRSFLPQ